jgi:hypothetical protein
MDYYIIEVLKPAISNSYTYTSITHYITSTRTYLLNSTFFIFLSTFLGSWIAIREIYFLAAIISVLISGSVLLTFFHIPNYYLPTHHIQRSLQDETAEKILSYLEAFSGKYAEFHLLAERSGDCNFNVAGSVNIGIFSKCLTFYFRGT